MKIVAMTLAISLISASAFANQKEATLINTTRAVSQDIVEITISGSLGSRAEKLYKSLSKVEEQSDDGMGGRHGLAKQGEAIDCSLENDAFASNAYTCTLKVSTSGSSLEPWK